MKNENTTITFSDLLLILKRSKRKIWLWAAVFGLAACLFLIIQPPVYMAEGTFREKSKTQTETSKNLSLALVFGQHEGSESAAVSLMKSRKLIEKVVFELGMQAHIKKTGFSFSWLRNALDNLQVEWDSLTNPMTSSLSENPLPITLQDIHYEGEIPLNLRLRFTAPHAFIVLDRNMRQVGSGTVGELFRNPHYAFTAASDSSNLQGSEYDVKLLPMKIAVEKEQKKLQVSSDTTDKSLLKLKYYNGNRVRASLFINTLMKVYVDYLKSEQQRIADEQIRYLHTRQDKEALKLKKILHEHAQAISSNTATMESLAHIQQDYTQRLLGIDLELTRLRTSLEGGVVFFDRYTDRVDTNAINHLLSEIREHQQQADTISKNIKEQNLLAALDENHLSQNPRYTIKGIDLASAQQLYMNYSKSLNDIEAEIVHHEFIIDKMKDKAFEPSSLSSFLSDPVSQDIITKAGTLVLMLKDQVNRSQRELDRIKDDLDQQRNFLMMHVEQMLKLLKLREELFREKLLSIQSMQLELILQKIGVLQKHLNDYITSRTSNLKQDKISIEQQQIALKQEMAKLPNQWASEQLIELHMEMTQKLIEEIAKLVESKNISTNLDVTQSAPLDKSLPPIHPQSPHLLIFALLGCIGGSAIVCACIFFNAVVHGVPATEQNIKLLGGIVAGSLAKNHPSEAVRQIIASLMSQKKERYGGFSLLLMVSNGVDYTEQMVLMLAKSCSTVLYIKAGVAPEGLMAYLEGKTSSCPIVKDKDYDTILLGEDTFHSELLTGTKFKELLNDLTLNYAWVVFASHCIPISGEGKMLSSAFDYSILTVTNETVDNLEDYIKPNVLFAFGQ